MDAALRVFPNPFKPTAALHFGMAEAASVQLVVYDALGRQVAVLAEGPLEAGEHVYRFESEHLTGGVYFARLTAGRRTETVRLTLLE